MKNHHKNTCEKTSNNNTSNKNALKTDSNKSIQNNTDNILHEDKNWKDYSNLIKDIKIKLEQTYIQNKINRTSYIILKSENDLYATFKSLRLLSIDALSRQLCYYPKSFQIIPSLKVILKRFHIYDLLIRGQTQEALIYYNKTFTNVSQIQFYAPIINYFNFIFKYSNVSIKLLRMNYLDFKCEFFNFLEKEANEKLNNSNILQFVCRVKGYNLGPCIPTDYVGEISLLKAEMKLIKNIALFNDINEKKIIRETTLINNKNSNIRSMCGEYNKDKYAMQEGTLPITYLDTFDYICEILQNKYCESLIETCISETDVTSNNFSNENSLLSENSNGNNFNSINNNRYNEDFNSFKNINLLKINQIELFKQKELPLEELIGFNCSVNLLNYDIIIFGNNKKRLLQDSSNVSSHKNISSRNSNKMYKAQKVIRDYSYISYRKSHSFLNNFPIRFIKKESLDKMIIRKFKKYLHNPKDNNLSLSAHKITNDTDNYYNSVSFLNDFIRNKFTPPFSYDNIKIKSFNTHYLIWLFSSNIICHYYKLFIEDYSHDFIDKILKEYDVINKEPEICDKLKYYINNLINIYNIDNYIDYHTHKAKEKSIHNKYNNNINISNMIIDDQIDSTSIVTKSCLQKHDNNNKKNRRSSCLCDEENFENIKKIYNNINYSNDNIKSSTSIIYRNNNNNNINTNISNYDISKLRNNQINHQESLFEIQELINYDINVLKHDFDNRSVLNYEDLLSKRGSKKNITNLSFIHNNSSVFNKNKSKNSSATNLFNDIFK